MITLLLNENAVNVTFLTSLTQEQFDTIMNCKRKDDRTNKRENLELYSQEIGIYCPSITRIGKVDLNKLAGLSSEVGYFLGKDTKDSNGHGAVGQNREVHYRDYSRPLEKQMKNRAEINLCQDGVSSAKTAFKQMDEEYCCIWKINKNTSSASEILELMGEKRWKIRH